MGACVDWGRAVYVAAIGGGLLWAVVVRLLAAGGDLPIFVIAAAMLIVLGVGAVGYRYANRSAIRNYAAGLAAVPVTGVAAMIPLLLIHLVWTVI